MYNVRPRGANIKGTCYTEAMISTAQTSRFAIIGLLSFLAALLNVALASMVGAFTVPLYFDSIFTIIVAVHLGVVPALVTAVTTNGLLAITGQVLFPFVICSILTALIVAGFRARHWLRGHTGYLWMGLAVAVANGVVGSWISFSLFSGVTEVHGIDRLVMGVLLTGQNMGTAVFWAGVLTNVMDKLISALVAFFSRSTWESLRHRLIGID